MEQFGRLGAIILLIARFPGITLSELVTKLAERGSPVTERTVAKDILLLKHTYGVLPPEPRLRMGYYLKDSAALAPQDLELVLDVLHAFAVRFNDHEAMELFSRLTALGSGGRHVSARGVRQHDIYYSGKTGSRIQGILLAAIRARQPISMLYVTPRLEKPLHIKGYPLSLMFHERGWYCIVRDLKSKRYQPRRVDRIKECKVLDAPLNGTHEDDLQEAEFLISCGWGMAFPRSAEELQDADAAPPIVVRFERAVASYILESVKRHPRATISSARDGTGDALLKIQLSDPQEFLYWVRSFGARAWVVSPQSAVERERAELRRMQQRYI